MESNYSNLVQTYFKAYETKERATLEKLLSEEFTFSSPVDDQINRETYLERCWPSSKDIDKYHIHNLFTDGNEAFVRYDCFLNSGVNFQNMERFRFSDNQITAIIVYFGFDFRKDTFAELRAKRFNDAFASGNVDYIIGNTANDVSWHLVGADELRGRESVNKMLEPMRGVVPKEYKTNNILIHGNKAVVEGTMIMPKANGEYQSYAYCDVYTFDQSNKETIKDLTAYLIELPNEKEKKTN
ncbi:SnoaL-like domain-containing protein [Gracilibacillus ureilyticus]|uniref:SnoaL-like domain-containing protein n=1 Tax=Gracilibacillus ureilyticus TaxID=531814 RepID=A0A1H9ML32_9BACI|nr:nuclear transport factor 2 family protein [Gracilibacillus ureilyticus]SER23863.1 SnoaL-like domain-containing protein [Gracilibacillus ureilyticus]